MSFKASQSLSEFISVSCKGLKCNCFLIIGVNGIIQPMATPINSGSQIKATGTPIKNVIS